MGNLTNMSAKWTMGNIADLTTPTSTQQYILGDILCFSDTDYKSVKKYMYVQALSAGMTAFQPYAITYSSTAGSEVLTIVPFTLAAPGSLICVPQVAFTASYYGWVLIQGDGKVLMTSETYVVGDRLKMTNGAAYLSVDGTSGATTIAVTNCAICKEAGSTAVARKVYLLGRMSVI